MCVQAYLDVTSVYSERACIGASNNLLAWLGRCKRLQVLDIYSFRVGDTEVPPHISHLTSLTYLRGTLTCAQVTDGDAAIPPPQRMCSHIAKLTNLQVLWLDAAHGNAEGGPVTSSELQELSSALPALLHLTCLRLNRHGRLEASAHAVAQLHQSLGRVQRLVQLSLEAPYAALCPTLKAAIMQLVNLKTFSLDVKCVEGDELVLPGPSCEDGAPAALPELRSIFCTWPASAQRADISSLADLVGRCPALVHLELTAPMLSDSDGIQLAVPLAHRTSLHTLKLPFSQGQGDGIRALAKSVAGLPEMRRCVFGTKDRSEDGTDADTHDELVPQAVWDEVLDIIEPTWAQHGSMGLALAFGGPAVFRNKLDHRILKSAAPLA